MVDLKRSPLHFAINEKATLVHHITEENSPLVYVATDVFDLKSGGKISHFSATHETCIVALTGRYTITVGETVFEKVGTRASVFEKKATDSLYVPPQQKFEIECESEGRLIHCQAPAAAEGRKPTLIKACDTTEENRGKYHNQRFVRNILNDQSKIAEKLLVVEVYTESANWSSYPPHKHDQNQLPEESLLEETYYHEVNPPAGFVFQRVYTDDELLDETMCVKSGEIVLVPKGYHPVGVPDGYSSYYLNIMAGPKKIWKFHNDPQHAWIIDRK
ncbi:MAG: 5-deoxy-glucuronate isomerase [Enterococcaceae bacterium]|jgi:5-deoxy-glucuronate isomerase|nr:5-deoxy-glucuronate isomerase [Enterococcaceae bacterium]MCI1920106.1 5-deoxy-glucuronate isomerase [Enterococcaceae bacterium]